MTNYVRALGFLMHEVVCGVTFSLTNLLKKFDSIQQCLTTFQAENYDVYILVIQLAF